MYGFRQLGGSFLVLLVSKDKVIMKKNMKVKIFSRIKRPPTATAIAPKFYKWHNCTSFRFLQLQCLIFLPNVHLTLPPTWFMCLVMHVYAGPENVMTQYVGCFVT